MTIGLLTTFYNWDRAYSLVSVVEEQLNSLLRNGYKPILFVHDNFTEDDKVPAGVEIRKVVPRFLLVDYSSNQPVASGFADQVKIVKEALEEHLKDIDVVFTHDWIFQGWFLVYNVGMREAQPNLKCKWLHWVHSAPSPVPDNLNYPHNCRYKTMPNSKLIYMNNYDALRLAEMYGGVLDDVRIVHNPLDPRTFWNLHHLVIDLINKYKLLDADIIDVYPVSSTRFSGKQVDKVIKLMGKLKEQGKSVRFICANAHANADKEKQAIESMLKYAEERGLTREEVIFTSLEGTDWELGIPHEAVRDLFLLSNLFIFPTLSENAPLILLEAALSKCLLVLNEDLPSLRDFFGKDALYFGFGSLHTTRSYSDEEQWYADVAKIIIGELSKNKPLNAFNTLRQKFNGDYIFNQELKPILYEQE